MIEAVQYEPARPQDPELDDFESGNSEVDRYFRSRVWFKVDKGKSSPPTFKFWTGDRSEVLGFAAVAVAKQNHPCDADAEKAKYLVIYAAGVYVRISRARGQTERRHVDTRIAGTWTDGTPPRGHWDRRAEDTRIGSPWTPGSAFVDTRLGCVDRA